VNRNARISLRLDNWNEQHQLGEVFNSSTGFRLPIELALPTDRIPRLCHKLVEYLTNGALLGWLILPAEEAVEVYRARQAPEVISQPTALSGEDVLPGCVLDLTEILA
jgi:Uma2 family endonuclease